MWFEALDVPTKRKFYFQKGHRDKVSWTPPPHGVKVRKYMSNDPPERPPSDLDSDAFGSSLLANNISDVPIVAGVLLIAIIRIAVPGRNSPLIWANVSGFELYV